RSPSRCASPLPPPATRALLDRDVHQLLEGEPVQAVLEGLASPTTAGHRLGWWRRSPVADLPAVTVAVAARHLAPRGKRADVRAGHHDVACLVEHLPALATVA